MDLQFDENESFSGSGELSGNCSFSEYDHAYFKIVAGIRTLTAVFSMICAICVLVIIVAFKKFKYFPQRLILYLSLTVIVHGIAYCLGRVRFHEDRELLDPYCQYFAGFFELYTAWSELLAIFCILVNIFGQIVFGVDSSRLEYILVLVISILPLAWCWIPYRFSLFGIQGPWCGIQIHTVDCMFDVTGMYLRFVLWQIPLFVIFFTAVVISTIPICVKLKQHVREWEGHCYDHKRQEAKQKIVNKIRPLIFYPLIYVLLKLPILGVDVYQAFNLEIQPGIALWILEAIFSPLAGAVIVVIYGFDSETVHHISQKSIKDICRACLLACKCEDKKDLVDYNIEMNTIFGDSIEGEAARQTAYNNHRILSEGVSSRNIDAFDII